MIDVLILMIIFSVFALGFYIVYEHSKITRERMMKELDDDFSDLDITLNDGLEHEEKKPEPKPESKPKPKTTKRKTTTKKTTSSKSKK